MIALNLNNIPDYSEDLSKSEDQEISIKDDLSQLAIPSSPAIVVKRNEFPIPFDLSSENTINPPIEIELFYTKVQNPNWISFGKIQTGSPEKVFHFKSQEDGEFAFVLQTTFKDGSKRFCPVLKINIARIESEKAKEIDPSKNPLPLLNIAQNNSLLKDNSINNQSKSENLSNSFEISSNDNNASKLENSTAIEPFPGAIKTIAYEYTQNNQTVIKIRWITPQEMGEEKGNGEVVQLERAKSLEGPWQIIANQLDCNEAGYQWVATQYDAEPFYLKSITTDQYGKDWTYIFPKLIELASILKFGNETAQSPLDESNSNETSTDQPQTDISGLSLPLQTEESQRPNQIQAWSDPPDIPAPENHSNLEESQSGEPNDSSETTTTVSKKTSASTNSLENAKRKLFDIKFSQQTQQVRPNVPPPTNPQQFSVNPLFTQGLGVIFQAQQARNPNGYIESPSSGNYSSQSPNVDPELNSVNKTPDPPKRRSIFALFNKQQESQIVSQQTNAYNSVKNIPTTGYQTQMNAFPPGQRSAIAEDGSPIYYDDGKGNLFDANGVKIDPSQIGQQLTGSMNGTTMNLNDGASFIPNNSFNPMFNGTLNENSYLGQNAEYSNYSGFDQGFSQGTFNQPLNLPLYYGDYPQDSNLSQNASINNQYGQNYSSNSLHSLPQPDSTSRPNSRSVLPPKPSTH
ncbi:MAG: hypothetical protein Q4C95_03215 [Planctomycetia bacterium]|nr:hypothetical protein [Planctomycetia bacterium]